MDLKDPRKRRYFHAHEASAESRSQLIELLCTDPAVRAVVTTVATYAKRSSEPERQQCLTASLVVIADAGIDAVVIDSRSGGLGDHGQERLDRRDRNTIRRLIRESYLTPATNVSFWNDRDEPKLWLPDVVAWTVRDSLVAGEPGRLGALAEVIVLVAAEDVPRQAKGTGRSRTRDPLGPPAGNSQHFLGSAPGRFSRSQISSTPVPASTEIGKRPDKRKGPASHGPATRSVPPPGAPISVRVPLPVGFRSNQFARVQTQSSTELGRELACHVALARLAHATARLAVARSRRDEIYAASRRTDDPDELAELEKELVDVRTEIADARRHEQSAQALVERLQAHFTGEPILPSFRTRQALGGR